MAKTIGVFKVTEITEEYPILDALDTGVGENHVIEVGATLPNLQVGQYVKLTGDYPIERTNDIFTKLKIGNHIVSVPNHRLEDE